MVRTAEKKFLGDIPKRKEKDLNFYTNKNLEVSFVNPTEYS